MKKPDWYRTLVLCMLLTTFVSKAHGQADSHAPADVLYPGFQLPDLQGSLHYAISASQRFTTNYSSTGRTVASSAIAGDLGYLSRSEVHPFSMIYAGGYLGDTSGQPSSAFHNLALSQVFQSRVWHLTVADAVSYLPTAPTAGLSGIPGLGDLGITPVVVGPDGGQSILTGYAPRVNNSTSATLQRNLTGSTTIEGSGSYLIQRFLRDQTNGGADSNQTTGIGGLTHRIDARNTISVNYTWSHYQYPGLDFSFVSQGGNIEFIRSLTRKINIDVTLGPQRTSASRLISPTTNLAATVRGSFTGEITTGGLSYTRGTNSGSGVVQGASTDSLSLDATRKFSRNWTGAFLGGYTRTGSLPGSSSTAALSIPPISTDIILANLQANRRIGNFFSFFLSYAVQKQSLSASTTLIGNAQNGVSHIVGFGITYSPSLVHLGH